MVDGGHEVVVAGWGKDAGERLDGAVRVVTVPEWRPRAGRKLVNRWRLKRFLDREARAGRIEIVEAPDYEGPLPWGVQGVPVVLRLHMTYTSIARAVGSHPPAKIARYERDQLAAVPAWIGVSRHVLELTRREFGIAPALSTVIANFVPASGAGEPAQSLPPHYVLFAGAVSEHKGAFDVARAARAFLPSHPGLMLVYVGGPHATDGRSPFDAIREILGELEDRVVFTGWIPRAQVRAAMRAAAAFVFPSRHESSSLVTLEAMAEGCPVVVPDEPPFTELVRDGETGLLAPRQPGAIAAAVSRLLDDAPLRDRIVRGARAFVRELTPERNREETLELYAQVLARERERRAVRRGS